MQIRKMLINSCIKNILIAFGVLIVLIFIVLQWLDIYTHHGKQVAVPDVKGMQVEQAAPFFMQKSLQYVVVDSMHVRNKPAGSILETVPPVGTNVKVGRMIYLTVNSVIAQMLTVPPVTDRSQRQAEAMLRSLGFENIRIRLVPGAYKDLVTGIETAGGTSVAAGSRLPANIFLTLLVGSGQAEIYVPNDSLTLSEDSEDGY